LFCCRLWHDSLAGLVILASQVLEYHLLASSSQSVSGFWGTYGTLLWDSDSQVSNSQFSCNVLLVLDMSCWHLDAYYHNDVHATGCPTMSYQQSIQLQCLVGVGHISFIKVLAITSYCWAILHHLQCLHVGEESYIECWWASYLQQW
jgi:hypothetical protein